MAISAKGFSIVASRYAGALMDLAEKAGAVEAVEKNLLDLENMIAQSKDLSMALHSPLIDAQEQKNAILAIADKAKFEDTSKSFLGVLADNGRLDMIEQVVAAYLDQASKRRGEMTVDVKVAQDLTDAQRKELMSVLEKSTGGNVKLNEKVDPSILGGMIVTVGSYMIDDSIARKLERLKADMKKQTDPEQQAA